MVFISLLVFNFLSRSVPNTATMALFVANGDNLHKGFLSSVPFTDKIVAMNKSKEISSSWSKYH